MGRVIPLPPFGRRESGGAMAGHGQDASAGMQTTTVAGVTWAYNVPMVEWQRVYPVSTLPNGLSGLAQQFYGDPTKWPDIYNVPQNKAIQGPNPNTGLIPGDTILIPGLAQPGPAPAPAPIVAPNGNVAPINVDTNGAAIVKAKPKSWWTPGKAVAIGAVGVVGVGLAIWAATRKKRRRRRK